MTKRAEEREQRAEKREYETPEVRSEEVFETLAAACNKTQVCSGTPGIPVVRS